MATATAASLSRREEIFSLDCERNHECYNHQRDERTSKTTTRTAAAAALELITRNASIISMVLIIFVIVLLFYLIVVYNWIVNQTTISLTHVFHNESVVNRTNRH
jgi:hypothetical protein